MSLAIFEFNDSALGHGTSVDDWLESPGYALLNDSGIITGEAARQQAWLQPQQSFQQFWHQLNLSPLNHQTRYARHHADLAFAQLQQLYRDSGEPEEVILAVPGNFTSEQLSLLLGLVNASPFAAVGLVDSALAAAAANPQVLTSDSVIHLDMQLHQSVITRLAYDHSSNTLQRTAIETISDLGLRTLLDSWAQFIGDLFIQHYRYDPLHTAGGEQQLFDQLPEWLQQLNLNGQTTASLDTRKGNFRLNLLKEQLLASSEVRIRRLQEGVAKVCRNGDTVLLSHRIARLPGISELFANATVLDTRAPLAGCLQYHTSIRSNPEALSFVTRLPVTLQPATTATVDNSPSTRQPTSTSSPTPLPTHALIGHKAVPIGNKQQFCIGEQGIEPCNGEPAAFQLTLNGAGLSCQVSDGFDIEAPAKLTIGSVIRAGSSELTLIEVL